MFANGHHSMMGSTEDPADGGKVATAVFGAVVVYGVRFNPLAKEKEMGSGELRGDTDTEGECFIRIYLADELQQVFLVFCGSQAFLHQRQRAGGEIALR